MVKSVTHERQEVLSLSRAWNHIRLIVQGQPVFACLESFGAQNLLCLNSARLLNNKFHGFSPSGGHHSLLLDQGFPNNADYSAI